MKRLLLILLAVIILTGCGAQANLPGQTEPVENTKQPVSIYIANSSVEQQTQGAVKAYVPEDAEYIGMAVMAGKVVLVSDLSKLTLIDGETGEVGTSIKVGETISCQETDFTASDDGISFYRDDGRELVFLNTALEQEAKVEIPEGISGHPCVSHANQEVYYCKDKEVRALHMQTGISRLVKSQVCQSIELVASHLDGTMLACRVIDEAGKASMVYMDSATGQTLDDVNKLEDLQTGATQYLVRRTEGICQQQIFGTLGGESQVFTAQEHLTAAFQLGGGYHWYMEDGALVMDYYDFTTGTHAAHARMMGVGEPIAIAADSKYIWILAGEGQKELLYRWDVSASQTGNLHSYIEPLYTRSQPDEQGLQQCAQRAEELKEKYGIFVHVGADALAVDDGYELTDEYLVPAMTNMMDRIETLLARFPAGFMEESLAKGQMHVSLVRDIAGNQDMVQFYENGDAYIILEISENIEDRFLHGLAYVIDSHVLGNSRDFDSWKKLNPEGFDYDYNYYVYDTHAASEYLTGETRAFADAYGMTFPHEDRSRLFVAAMGEDNAELFATDVMQAKLKRLCQGIREAYSYERSKDVYAWEQYLSEPLARK